MTLLSTAASSSREPPPKAPGTTGRVFVVEDEAVVSLQIRDILSCAGLVICGHASSGEAALEGIESVKPDVILMDIRLAGSMTGLEVVEALGVQDAAVVFLTAHADRALTERAVRAGAKAYVVKPFLPEVLLANVEMALSQLRAAREIRQSEATFRAFFEQAASGVAEVDVVDGRVVRANRRFSTMLGYEDGELARAELGRLISRSDLDRVLRSDSSECPVELRLVRKDGSDAWADVSMPDRGGARRFVCTVTDISARARHAEEHRNLEEHPRQGKEMNVLAPIASGLAQQFDAAVSNARTTVRKLTSCRPQRTAVREVGDLPSVVAGVADMIRPMLPEGIRLSIRASTNTPKVLMDVNQIRQLLVNLVVNASRAIPDGVGNVTMQVEGCAAGREQATVHLLQGRAHACIEVSDDGVGMSGEMLSRVFEPFFTTRKDGSGAGLGLSIVHGIVADHGGLVQVESSVGNGTTVRVLLPALTTTDAAWAPAADIAPDAMRPHRVMHVDDDPLQLSLMARVLKILGCDAVSFGDPAIALRALQDDPTGFGLLITDLNMPGMSGLELAAAARVVQPDLPAVLLTGSYVSGGRDDRPASIHEVLQKPISRDDVERILRTYLPPNSAAAPA